MIGVADRPEYNGTSNMHGRQMDRALLNFAGVEKILTNEKLNVAVI